MEHLVNKTNTLIICITQSLVIELVILLKNACLLFGTVFVSHLYKIVRVHCDWTVSRHSPFVCIGGLVCICYTE